ncbi:MAG: hypothetical protein HYS05_04785 [Acidobacteria bacterium]|nr:hypothetical protein [Acidobacteriota bacterium]
MHDRHQVIHLANPPEAAPVDATTVEQAKQRLKEQKRMDATRPLDSWERYRALNDAMDEAYELVDIANREARFAVIIMGALNAALYVIGTRTDAVKMIPQGMRPWMAAAFVAYGAVSLHFFIAAIETLRPRRFRPRLSPPEDGTAENYPAGVRYYEDVVLRDADNHWQAWREVHIGQLNAELAVQVHSLCLKNRAKHAALRRLYDGLRILTLIVAALLMLIGFFEFR